MRYRIRESAENRRMQRYIRERALYSIEVSGISSIIRKIDKHFRINSQSLEFLS